MSLPIAGASKSPTRPATHTELDAARMLRISTDLEEALAERGESALSPAVIEDIAFDLGIRESHLYVAAATWTQIPCLSTGPVQIEVCVGNCQKWGGAELLERVLEVDGRRRSAGQPSFDVIAKSCLDRCAEAAVVRIRTPDGIAGLTATNLAALDEALESV